MLQPFDERRPWGLFRQFTSGENTTVKILTIHQGEQFSLQHHTRRSEFWRILSGTPNVTIGEKVIPAHPGDEFEIPIGVSHRIAAPNDDVECLEISFGTFDENDIIRTEDKYGRA